MLCSYCNKLARGGIVFELIEDVPGEGPAKRRACFPCINEIGEKIMRPAAVTEVHVTLTANQTLRPEQHKPYLELNDNLPDRR